MRLVVAKLESGKFHKFRAMTGFPMDFADFENGQRINIVCTLKVFDHTHNSHLMTLLNGCDFHLEGLLNVGFDSYTIFSRAKTPSVFKHVSPFFMGLFPASGPPKCQCPQVF